MPTGLQRDGLKAQEVFKIRAEVERMLADGEEPDVAYALACRAIVGVDADTFKRWKPDIFKLIEGKPTLADSLLSGALVPEQGKPADSAAFKRVKELGSELDAVKEDHERLAASREQLANDHARLLEENAKLKKQLEENVLGEAPKTPAKPPK